MTKKEALEIMEEKLSIKLKTINETTVPGIFLGTTFHGYSFLINTESLKNSPFFPSYKEYEIIEDYGLFILPTSGSFCKLCNLEMTPFLPFSQDKKEEVKSMLEKFPQEAEKKLYGGCLTHTLTYPLESPDDLSGKFKPANKNSKIFICSEKFEYINSIKFFGGKCPETKDIFELPFEQETSFKFADPCNVIGKIDKKIYVGKNDLYLKLTLDTEVKIYFSLSVQLLRLGKA